jgi:C-terminal peptidase prc
MNSSQGSKFMKRIATYLTFSILVLSIICCGTVLALDSESDELKPQQSTEGKKEKPKEKPGEEKPEDYWKEVRFDRLHFKEVRELVRLHYIDAEIEGSFAFQRSANFALSTADEQLELIPRAYFKKKKREASEENKHRWAGKVRRLRKQDSFVVLKHVKDWKKKNDRRLDDDEIRAERIRRKEEYRALKEAWSATGFSEEDFFRVVNYALKLRKEDTREDTIWIAAAQGYLASLDPHSNLISEAAWKASTDEIRDSSFEGIGALLMQRHDDIIVESPLEGQPAAKAGLYAGDIIVKVDGVDVRGMPLTKVVAKIRGPKGTEVVLTVQRVGMPEDIDVAIRRSIIPFTNISARMMGPQHAGFGLVKVRGFVSGTTNELKSTIEDLANKSETGQLRGLILDLRNNSGGLLQEAVFMSDLFLKDGRIVSVKSRTSSSEHYTATTGGDLMTPIIVLVNDGTASAAEIVANAIQENHRGLVIGDRSFGKATVQSLLTPIIGSGYYVKLTVARYYGPDGHTLQVRGIVPDVSVTPDVEGKMPLGFREMDLYDHLPKILTEGIHPNAKRVLKLRECVDTEKLAEQIHAADPNPIIKFDYPLFKGADWLECMIGERTAAR